MPGRGALGSAGTLDTATRAAVEPSADRCRAPTRFARSADANHRQSIHAAGSVGITGVRSRVALLFRRSRNLAVVGPERSRPAVCPRTVRSLIPAPLYFWIRATGRGGVGINADGNAGSHGGGCCRVSHYRRERSVACPL